MCLGAGIDPLTMNGLAACFTTLCVIAVIVGYATTTVTYFTGFESAVRRVYFKDG